MFKSLLTTHLNYNDQSNHCLQYFTTTTTNHITAYNTLQLQRPIKSLFTTHFNYTDESNHCLQQLKRPNSLLKAQGMPQQLNRVRQ
ncbi:hypothetical protein DPMN_064902 [Dreissena polymorpha]|uniref:Uncharacterized protein n=1 Tax=Dreissena polymorpha TaxID=45954 RepID=A0A9D4HLG3_DREPO|nr:hypothetical protein DPMN_064902 [Dreissena polymorpha]